ncbi:MAG: hypothetical protein PUB89_10800 [Oscillospiraceae bacterium]|nr:hypothetical protein [Oscillospiraceae bacterium]
MIKKIIATIATFCLISCSGISVNAAEIFMEQTNSSSVYSVGLISNCSVSISVSGTDLYLSGFTYCTDTMKKVGITDIKIQRSTNNSSWSDYSPADDLIRENSTCYDESSVKIGSIVKGYYYRITCKHYAKEYGLFGKSESISNTSNSVYVP